MLSRHGCPNSGEPITVVPELTRYVRNSKTSFDNYNNGDGQTRYVKRYMTDRLFSRIVGSLGRRYVVRHASMYYLYMMDLNRLI